MELRHLRYFVAVAEELNFSRAAERLQMAQPPLSHQILQLEAELDVQLFQRTKRSVKLTYAGQIFLEEARRTLAQCNYAAQAAQRASRGEIGCLAIGFISSVGYSVLPELLRLFRSSYPDVALALRELNPDEQVQALLDGKIDLGLIHLSLEDDRLDRFTLLKENLVVALPETHPLSGLEQVPIAALVNEAFILPPRHRWAGLREQVVALCQQAGFYPQEAQEVSLMQTTICLVAGELGIALVPASMQSMQRQGVVYRPIAGAASPVELMASWHKQNHSPVLESFLRVIKQFQSIEKQA